VRALQKAAYVQQIPVENLPDLLRFRGEPSRHASALDAPLLSATLQALGRRLFFATKRFLDIIISVGVLATLAPVLLVLAMALRATVGGPVLFRQVRPGRSRVPFVLYKLRTMRDLFAPDGTPLPDALRTPWLGRAVRRSRLDELPQFWNVLVGDMSIIGPRPMLETDLAQLPVSGRGRYAFRPGITGWAQVHGGQQLTPVEKVALDLWYVRHASLALDLKIAFLTVRMMICGERVNHAVIERAKAAMVTA
jgi:lipopolysaccharide/colanic/teichoic acid biosynthesis glycosyltransferase